MEMEDWPTILKSSLVLSDIFQGNIIATFLRFQLTKISFPTRPENDLQIKTCNANRKLFIGISDRLNSSYSKQQFVFNNLVSQKAN